MEKSKQNVEYYEPKIWKKKKKGPTNLFLPIVLISVVILAGIIIFSGDTDGDSVNTGNLVGDEIRISLSELSTTSKLYEYKSDGIKIKYFAVKGSDGDYHVAFDACDVCYEAKKGYQQVGDAMQCKNCGRTFAINSIGTDNLEGGCWPSYLPRSEDGNKLVIKVSDVVTKKYMFT